MNYREWMKRTNYRLPSNFRIDFESEGYHLTVSWRASESKQGKDVWEIAKWDNKIYSSNPLTYTGDRFLTQEELFELYPQIYWMPERKYEEAIYELTGIKPWMLEEVEGEPIIREFEREVARFEACSQMMINYAKWLKLEKKDRKDSETVTAYIAYSLSAKNFDNI